MDIVTSPDVVTTLGRALVGLVESGGFLLAMLALLGALAAAFCLGRLVERAAAGIRRAGAPPPH